MTTGTIPGGNVAEGVILEDAGKLIASAPETTRVRRALPVLVLAALLATGALAGFMGREWLLDWTDVWEVLASPGRLREYLGGFGAWAPAAFFLVQAAQVVVSVIPAAPVTVAGVAAVGPWVGFALALGGALFGSLAAFCLGRRFGTPVVVRLVGRRALDRYAEKLGGNGGLWILPVLLLPLPVGGDAVCALAGLTKIPTRRFLALSLLGRTPGTVLNVLLASGLATGSVVLLAAGAVAAAAMAGAAFLYARRCGG